MVENTGNEKGNEGEPPEAKKPEVDPDKKPKVDSDKKPKKDSKPKKTIKIKKKHVFVGGGAVLAAIVLGLILLSVFPLAKGITDQPVAGIKAGYAVNVNYKGTLLDGSTFDEGNLDVKAGRGEVIKGFDDALLGMEVGDKKTVTIPAKDAYGEYDPKKTVAVPLV